MATTATLHDAARGIINASVPLPWLVVSGQPTELQFMALRDAGVSTVIDLRESMEPRALDEPSVVRGLGVRYVNAPVVSGALDDRMMGEVLGALREAHGNPTLLHCNSANRTGGPLIAYLMLDRGLDEGSAVETAMRGGLRSVELLEWATEYVMRQR